MKNTTKNGGNKQPKSLVANRLEGVSKDVFKKYFQMITNLIGGSPGVYALYNERELYYVGKSSELRKRVRQHLRDRHLASWTHFSLYLARKEEHIHEIESLLVRIANPKGNKIIPRGKSRGPLLRELRRLITQRQKEELSELLGGAKSKASVAAKKAVLRRRSLIGLVTKRQALFRQYKGREHKAVLTPNGQIIYRGNSFKSPSGAARAVIGRKRAVNGWTFWSIKDAAGDWIPLMDFAK
jgi:hypothetical protein